MCYRVTNNLEDICKSTNKAATKQKCKIFNKKTNNYEQTLNSLVMKIFLKNQHTYEFSRET